MRTSRQPGGHRSELSLTSRIRMAKPIEKSTPTNQETWPEYLRMQYPGATLIDDSGCFGELKVHLPSTPTSSADLNLSAHYLWDSSLLLSQLNTGSAQQSHDLCWSVRSLHVLELGSGTGLVGIICALAGAEETVLTDYPSVEILEYIRTNVDSALSPAKIIIEAREQCVCQSTRVGRHR